MTDEDGPKLGPEYSLINPDGAVARSAVETAFDAFSAGHAAALALRDANRARTEAENEARQAKIDRDRAQELASKMQARSAAQLAEQQRAVDALKAEVKAAEDKRQGVILERNQAHDRIEQMRARIQELEVAQQAGGGDSVVIARLLTALQRAVVEQVITSEDADWVCSQIGVAWKGPRLIVQGRVNFTTALVGIDPNSFDPKRPQELAGEQLYVGDLQLGGYGDTTQVPNSTEVSDLLIDRVEWSYE